MRPWRLAELTYAEVKQRGYEVAVIPLGCTEPHNLHLPYGTDTLEAEIIGDHICESACDAGAKVVLLPTIPYGTVTNQRECPLSINVNPSTLFAFLRDLIDSLEHHGIHKIVLLNSHGGNELKPLLRELYGARAAHVFVCNWYECVRDVYGEIFDELEDHAGEMETSLALAYFPELVAKRDDGSLRADEGATAQTRFEAVNRGWVYVPRRWDHLTTNTGAGNPHAASAEKGRRLMKVLVERLSCFLAELSAPAVDERFPFVEGAQRDE